MIKNNQPDGMEDSEITALVLKEATKLGASDAEVALGHGHGLSIKVRNQELESIEHQNDKALSVSFYLGQQKGTASTSDLRPESILSTVASAKDIARYSDKDPCIGLADYDDQAPAPPTLDLCHSWNLKPADASELAIATEKAALQYDPRISNSEGSYVNSYREYMVYSNTAGRFHQWQETTHSMHCEVIAKDQSGMQANGWHEAARHAGDLPSAATIGQRAAKRTLHRLSPQPCASKTAMVMFEAPVAREFLSNLVRALQGGNLYRKSSFLLERLGHKIFPEWVNILEQPHIPRGMSSAPIDAEGVTTTEKYIIRDGVVASYLLGSYAARRLGMKSTANAGGVHNMVVQSGIRTFEQLLQDMGTGLVVTELMGSGTNLVTGDYSQGAAGFWVEGGTISHAVEQVSVAANLEQMFQKLVAVGSDLDDRGFIHTGSLLFDDITIAGNAS